MAWIWVLAGLVATWGRGETDFYHACRLRLPMLPAACLQALVLAVFRLRYGWKITTDAQRAVLGPVQFTLRRALLWMAAIAALFALGTWTDWDVVAYSGQRIRWDRSVRIAVVLYLATFPLVVPGVGLALSDRWHYAAWLSAASLLVFAVLGILSASIDGPALGNDIVWASRLDSGSLVAGFLVGFLGMLLPLRACGYRLVPQQ